MNRKPITVEGQYDHLFVDDRDQRISIMSIQDSQPRYGANHLRRPGRALTMLEAEAMNKIGMPVDPTLPE